MLFKTFFRYAFLLISAIHKNPYKAIVCKTHQFYHRLCVTSAAIPSHVLPV